MQLRDQVTLMIFQLFWDIYGYWFGVLFSVVGRCGCGTQTIAGPYKSAKILETITQMLARESLFCLPEAPILPLCHLGNSKSSFNISIHLYINPNLLHTTKTNATDSLTNWFILHLTQNKAKELHVYQHYVKWCTLPPQISDMLQKKNTSPGRILEYLETWYTQAGFIV